MAAARIEPPSIDPSDARAALIERVRRAIARAQAIPVVAAEECAEEELLPLHREVMGALDDAHEVLGAVLDRYDREPDVDELDFELGDRASTVCRAVEARFVDEPRGPEKITGIAFVGRIGIRGRRELVAVASVHRRWDLIAACSSAVREILKSLSAIEIAVAEHEGCSVTTRYYVTELDRSLRVRRAYFTFRAEVLGDGPPPLHDAARRLRSAASALAKLISREAYGFARVHDRSSLREIQRRIREQLTAHATAQVEAVPARLAMLDVMASRLWQDLANLTELMLLVNNRAELRDHDRKLLHEVHRALADDELDAERARSALAELLGRDPDLDRWIRAGSRELAPLRPLVAAALEMLDRTCADEPAPESRRRGTDAPGKGA